MDHRLTSNKSAPGVALIIAMLAVLVLTVLAGSIIFVAQTQTWAVTNYRLATQARYAAEAGIQRTMNWMINSYTAPTSFGSYNMNTNPVQYNGNAVVLSAMSGVSSNYPDATQQSAFNAALSSQSIPGVPNATFSTYATLLRMTAGWGVSWFGGGSGAIQTWQITSQGNIGGLRAATVQVVATYERTGTPIFSNAVFATGTGCGTISMRGSSFVDSFDSSLGTYPAGQENGGGNIGTNGNLSISGGFTVNGMLFGLNGNTTGTSCSGAAPSLVASDTAKVTGGITGLAAAVTYPTPAWTPYSGTFPTGTQSVSGASCANFPSGCTLPGQWNTIALAPANYGNINASGSAKVQLSAGTYYLYGATFSDSAQLLIPSTGQVVLNFDPANTGTVVNMWEPAIVNPGSPSNLQIVYGGTGSLILYGGWNSSAVVYAPNAAITLSGGADWMGAIIANTVDDSGGTAIHYDRSLGASLAQIGNFQPEGFSWSKY